MKIIMESQIQAFENDLQLNEKSKATIKKYKSAVQKLAEFLEGTELTKQRLLEYREYLQAKYKVQTVNGELSAINAFLNFCGWQEYRIKFLKVQRQAFLQEARELSKEEYERLLNAALAKKNERLYLLMLTLGSSGIRISELSYITVETLNNGRAEIHMKGKTRTVILQKELRKKLLKYADGQEIESGCVFRTKSGKPLDRSNICHDMKKLSKEAKVDAGKIFPHNLRHLFARSFYAVEKNLAYLADVLGHSRIETTRIYVAASVTAHEKILNRMQLVI